MAQKPFWNPPRLTQLRSIAIGTSQHEFLGDSAVSQTAVTGTRNSSQGYGNGGNSPLQKFQLKKFSFNFPRPIRRPFAGASAPDPSLSLVAGLAILALIAAWLAMVARWHQYSISVDLSSEATLYHVVADDSRFERILRGFALMLFLTAGFLGAVKSRRSRLPGLVAVLLATMIMYCAFWCLVSYKPSDEWTLLIGNTSPLIFAMCLGVFAGFDPTLWRPLRSVALAIAWSSVALGAYYTVSLTMKGTFAGSNPTVEHLQTAFWFGLTGLVLHKSSRWRDCLPALIPIALCIPMAIIAISRSFTLLAALGLVTGLLVPLQRYFRLLVTRVFVLGVLSALVLGLGWWLLSMAAPERVLALKERLNEDTRSSQYTQFFQQVPVESLILGLGPKATYTYNDRANYDYIDNQFLFILFKFGLPVLLGYSAIAIWPGLHLLIIAGSKQQRLIGVIFVFWTLAGLGVAIYHAITLNPQNFAVILLAGRAFSLTKTAGRSPFPRHQKPLRATSQPVLGTRVSPASQVTA